MDEKRYDWLDWLIILSPVIITQGYIWYRVYKGEIDMITAILSALIGGAFVILGIVVKEFFYDKKNYAKLVDALGNLQKGAPRDNLTKQNDDIVSALGITEGNISSKIGDTKTSISAKIGDTEKGTLTAQHDTILAQVSRVNNRAEAADLRNASLSSDLREISSAIKTLDAFLDRLERQNEELNRLHNIITEKDSEIAKLKADSIEFDIDPNVRDIRGEAHEKGNDNIEYDDEFER
ncbi:MAG: hypothetical protein LBN34_03095 [Clostridiales Family XIII bacterium]|jgi:chromosome segregation ATPase|nr:hypothetical protein [Clostridiales Family XIII bacterium]